MCRAGLTLDHTAHDEAHGEADQGHKHPEGHQEVPILTHTEQLLLQPLQATWSRGVGSQPGTSPSVEAWAGSGQEGQGQRGARAGDSIQGGPEGPLTHVRGRFVAREGGSTVNARLIAPARESLTSLPFPNPCFILGYL